MENVKKIDVLLINCSCPSKPGAMLQFSDIWSDSVCLATSAKAFLFYVSNFTKKTFMYALSNSLTCDISVTSWSLVRRPIKPIEVYQYRIALYLECVLSKKDFFLRFPDFEFLGH